MSAEETTNTIESPFRRAVLLAIKPKPPPLGTITDHTPAYLLPLAGKCLADRIVGRLGDIGITEITILIAGNADAAQAFFGNGTRWGMNIQLVDVRTPKQAIERLKTLNTETPLLLGDLYRFPVLDAEHLLKMSIAGTAVLTGPKQSCTGWAALAPDAIGTLPAATTPEQLFEKISLPDNTFITNDPILGCLSAQDILSSTNALLGNQVKNQVVSGASGDPGLWIGAGSIIHPKANLVPPVWIGENCRIERDARLGPNVTIADNCVLGESSVIQNSCVLPGTCIGNELELDGTVADRNYLAYADGDLTVAIPDPFLLAPNKPLSIASSLGSLLGRVLALLLLLPILPALALFWLLGLTFGQLRPIEVVECIRLPAPTDPMLWKTFGNWRWASGKNHGWNVLCNTQTLKILAAIPNIALGRLRWVGLAPRTVDETMALSEDWKMLYLGCKPGLFQLADIDQRQIGDSSKEQLFSSEAFYAATLSMKQDMSIILRSLFTPAHRPAAAPETSVLTLSTGDDTLDQLHEFLNHELSDGTISKERKDAITTAVHEALVNIIKHAYELHPGLPIQMHLRKDSNRVELGLFDKGKLFDPSKISEPDFSGAASSGFGWHLINSIADDVGFSRFNDWNHLTLVFDHNAKGDTQNDH